MFLGNIRFAEPLAFLLLLFIPLSIWYEVKIKKYPTLRFSSLKLVARAQGKKKLKHRHFLLGLRMLVLILIIFSMARPQKSEANTEIMTKGINIFLNIDTSGSMQAIDLQIGEDKATRLEVVKAVVKKFIAKRHSDPIGLIVFGTEAFTQSPLTLDYDILTDFLDSLEIGMAGPSTAIGNSIGLAVKRLKDLDAKSKVIILLTDGTNNAGKLSPEKSTEIAQKYKIKIYTIGVGTSGRVPFIQDTFIGPQIVYRQADLDEHTLKMISSKTGGKYYRAKNTQELEKIYDDIDRLEKSEINIKKYMLYEELFHYLLIPAIILLLIEIILANTRFIQIP